MNEQNQNTKSCKRCGQDFIKNKRDSFKQWTAREFCSIDCANKLKKPVTSSHSRFWNYVKVMKNKCWEWTGSKDIRGYGRISTKAGMSPAKAHRISWEIHYGKIPHGLNVLHACDNPSCVNPNHLMIGSQQANTIDMSRKKRISNESLLNLRPGQKGIHGAGSLSNRDISNAIS
jgi:hypothetical protein